MVVVVVVVWVVPTYGRWPTQTQRSSNCWHAFYLSPSEAVSQLKEGLFVLQFKVWLSTWQHTFNVVTKLTVSVKSSVSLSRFLSFHFEFRFPIISLFRFPFLLTKDSNSNLPQSKVLCHSWGGKACNVVLKGTISALKSSRVIKISITVRQLERWHHHVRLISDSCSKDLV